MSNENAVLWFTPKISIRAERVAQVLNISIDRANALLSEPNTKALIQAGLDQAFHSTVGDVIRGLSHLESIRASSPAPAQVRRDCVTDVSGIEFNGDLRI